MVHHTTIVLGTSSPVRFVRLYVSLEVVHKRRPQSRGGGYLVRTRGEGGSSDAGDRTFSEKNFGCFEIYGVSARTRGEGVEPVRTFFGQGELIFRDFVRMSFMDGPLVVNFNSCQIN